MDREIIVPAGMEAILRDKGYAPALRVGPFLFIAGQLGRTRELEVIHDPEAQFLACFENLREVLAAAGCGFADVVDLTTYHVDLPIHGALFRTVKQEVFARQSCPWTSIGVAALASPGLLVEIKATALVPGR